MGESRDYYLDYQARKGNGTEKPSPKVEQLSTVPIPLPYLNLLLDNKGEVSWRDIGRIALPSMPAFMLHKLLIASLPARKEKREKDFKQVCAVAKSIIADENLMEEVRRLLKNMPQSWQNKINASALCISDYVADGKVDLSTFLSYFK